MARTATALDMNGREKPQARPCHRLDSVDEFSHSDQSCSAMSWICCCRGYSARLLFLMGCAMIEYIAHTVMLILAPMIALHFYPNTATARIGFYTAILAGSGYLGHALSCRLWINIASSLGSSKGVILWSLAIIGTGFFSLILCQSLLAMAIVRFAMGLCSGVAPVAFIEIDNICGNRQTRLVLATKYLGIAFGSSMTLVLIVLGKKWMEWQPASNDLTTLYLYPLCFVSVIAWIAVVITLVGLRMQTRASYVALRVDEIEDTIDSKYRTSLSDDSPLVTNTTSTKLELVKSAFEETFRRSHTNRRFKDPLQQLLMMPRPHFRLIRSIIPHYYHGYTESGHVVIWDLIGRIALDKLHTAGFTTMDIREHYQFFIQFALERLLKSNSSTQKIVYIIDLEGLTLTDVDERVIESIRVIISELQTSFPGRLHQLAVIHVPVWFSQVMGNLKSHISKKTHDKMVFYTTDESIMNGLQELIGVDSLPKKYGGRNGVEMGKSSQERALEDHLKQTTGSLENTKEIYGNSGVVHRGRTSSLLRDGDVESDEEAFFDCSEYGLRDSFMDADDNDEISIVLHSQTNHDTLVARNGNCPPKPLTLQRLSSGDTKVHDMESGTKKFPTSVDSSRRRDSTTSDNNSELAIAKEPHTILILVVFALWLLIQLSFDDIFPLWFFRSDHAENLVSSTQKKRVHSAHDNTLPTIPETTMHVSASMASMAVIFLCGQIFLCRSSNAMTPLATLRLGLLLQIPVTGGFPLLDVFNISHLPFARALIVFLLVLKHAAGGVVMHGLMALIDNSIAVDRRLVAHRAAHVVTYVVCLIGSGASPAIFALLGYFSKPFPFDQSLIYFVQALGLVFLFFFSFFIPSRLNFPLLFAMSKR